MKEWYRHIAKTLASRSQWKIPNRTVRYKIRQLEASLDLVYNMSRNAITKETLWEIKRKKRQGWIGETW